jgi:hypothetical protein
VGVDVRLTPSVARTERSTRRSVRQRSARLVDGSSGAVRPPPVAFVRAEDLIGAEGPLWPWAA